MTTNVKEQLYFYSFEELVNFSKNNVFRKEGIKQYPYSYEKDVERYSSLVVEGFSELVVCYNVNASLESTTGKFEYYYLDNSFLLLHEVGTDRYYHINGKYNANTFEFSLFVEGYRHIPLYFSFGKKQPNNVGKATKKKLQAWFDYIQEKESALASYVNAAADKRSAFVQKLEASGLDVQWRGKNKGWVDKGAFRFSFEIDETGYAHTKTELNYNYASMPLDKFLSLPVIE